jgi:phosphoglycolate phosphatase-like HAD superfamily hydrolase
MHLAMFDIDGTLTQTNTADTDCYVRAVCEVLKLKGIDSDWHNYQHVTDSGIATELIDRLYNRAANPSELSQICDRFVGLLNHTFYRNRSLCHEVRGAGRVLEKLKTCGGIAIALATGGWERSARLKLHCAGIDVTGLAIATADDAIERDSIMQIAIDRAAVLCGSAKFKSIIYIGDGLWDWHASQRMGIPFIGIGSDERAEQLRAAGAKWVLPDYGRPSDFFGALAEASGLRI